MAAPASWIHNALFDGLTQAGSRRLVSWLIGPLSSRAVQGFLGRSGIKGGRSTRLGGGFSLVKAVGVWDDGAPFRHGPRGQFCVEVRIELWIPSRFFLGTFKVGFRGGCSLRWNSLRSLRTGHWCALGQFAGLQYGDGPFGRFWSIFAFRLFPEIPPGSVGPAEGRS